MEGLLVGEDLLEERPDQSSNTKYSSKIEAMVRWHPLWVVFYPARGFMAILLLLAFAGITLIFLEFFLPGAVLAVMGTLSLLVSLGLCFTKYPALWGIIYLLLILIAVFATCKVAVWAVKRSKAKGNKGGST